MSEKCNYLFITTNDKREEHIGIIKFDSSSFDYFISDAKIDKFKLDRDIIKNDIINLFNKPDIYKYYKDKIKQYNKKSNKNIIHFKFNEKLKPIENELQLSDMILYIHNEV